MPGLAEGALSRVLGGDRVITTSRVTIATTTGDRHGRRRTLSKGSLSLAAYAGAFVCLSGSGRSVTCVIWEWRQGKMIRHCIFGVMALCVTASPLLADDLYCTDTDANGFKWDKSGAVRSKLFVEERFTVKIISDRLLLITRRTGELAGKSSGFSCTHPFELMPDRIACNDTVGGEMWVFFRTTYVHTFLAGPPAGGADPNIFVSYGTCTTKF